MSTVRTTGLNVSVEGTSDGRADGISERLKDGAPDSDGLSDGGSWLGFVERLGSVLTVGIGSSEGCRDNDGSSDGNSDGLNDGMRLVVGCGTSVG